MFLDRFWFNPLIFIVSVPFVIIQALLNLDTISGLNWFTLGIVVTVSGPLLVCIIKKWNWIKVSYALPPLRLVQWLLAFSGVYSFPANSSNSLIFWTLFFA